MDRDFWFGLIMDDLVGVLTGQDGERLKEWRRTSSENEQTYSEIRKLWDGLASAESGEMFDWQRAYRLFQERTHTEPATRAVLKRSHLLRRYAYRAAAVALLLGTGYLSYRYFTGSYRSDRVALSSEVTVPYGSTSQVSLQDGTLAWLNAGTVLRYGPGFGRNNRDIYLSGEACFEVAKNRRSPFIVDVEGIKVKALGTRFNVRAYRDDDGVTVALTEGEVEIITQSGTTGLTPGRIARYDAATGTTSVSTGAVENSLAWMSNQFIFSGETFEQIVQELERRYGVAVNMNDEQLRKRRFAGNFTNNETLEQILAVMSINGKFCYKVHGNIIDIINTKH
jgi:ferric-dicitrate binding protein FerR (iron transport regulator)